MANSRSEIPISAHRVDDDRRPFSPLRLRAGHDLALGWWVFVSWTTERSTKRRPCTQPGPLSRNVTGRGHGGGSCLRACGRVAFGRQEHPSEHPGCAQSHPRRRASAVPADGPTGRVNRSNRHCEHLGPKALRGTCQTLAITRPRARRSDFATPGPGGSRPSPIAFPWQDPRARQ